MEKVARVCQHGGTAAHPQPPLPQSSGPRHHEVIFPLCLASWTLSINDSAHF